MSKVSRPAAGTTAQVEDHGREALRHAPVSDRYDHILLEVE